jgi:hypothetical protein
MHALEQVAGEHVQQDAGPQGAKSCRTSLPGRALPCKSSLTKPLVKAYSVRLGWLLGKTRCSEPLTRRAKMALHDRIALQAGALGIRAELNAAEVFADYAGGLRRRLFRQKNELLAKKGLRSKGIIEGVYRKQFPHVPRVALPPFQFPHETSCQADHKRPPVSGVLLGVMEGHCKVCEFC